MMIYNTVDYPIAIEIGEKIYFMDRDSELELRLTSGTYDYRLYKADEYDGPIPSHIEMRSFHRHSVTVCYAETGKLICRRNTKVYIREDRIELFREQYFWRHRGHSHYRTYDASTFNLTVEEGELAERRQGCLNQQVYNQMLAPYKATMWILGAEHLIFLVFAALFGFGVFELHHTVSYVAMIGCLLAQVVLFDTDLKKICLLRVLKSVPVLVDVQDLLQH
ncbi:MAG: hypothetical protein IJX76_03035 [Clostridia bacterium]|nr:hypothetical protein [Clostridia bacterium]